MNLPDHILEQGMGGAERAPNLKNSLHTIYDLLSFDICILHLFFSDIVLILCKITFSILVV